MACLTGWHKSVGRKQFQGERGQRKRSPKNNKKDRKIALLSLFQGGRGQRKIDRKIAKKTENSKKDQKITCIKIQGGGTRPP